MATVQKAMISACNRLGKPTLITRVVDTMAQTPRCTRWVLQSILEDSISRAF